MPPPPPQNLQGQWSAKPNEKISIALALNPDGTFAWTVSQVGKSQTIQGRAGYQDQILTLAQDQQPPLVGKITIDPAGNRFAFKPPGTPESAAGLSFEKVAAATAPVSDTSGDGANRTSASERRLVRTGTVIVSRGEFAPLDEPTSAMDLQNKPNPGRR